MSDYQLNISDKYKNLTAIVVRDTGNNTKVFHKYRNIRNTSHGLRSFLRFTDSRDSINGCLIHINFYDKETKNFVCQWKK